MIVGNANISRKLLALLLLVIGVPSVGVVFALSIWDKHVVILTAAAVALGGYVFITHALWIGQVHNRILAYAIGIVFIIAVYGFYHYVGYLLFRRDFADLASGGLSIDEWLRRFTDSDGFIGYIRIRLDWGTMVQISPVSWEHAGGSTVLLYWVGDLLILSASILFGVHATFRQPFCAVCNQYYGYISSTGRIYPNIPLAFLQKESLSRFILLMAQERFEQAGVLLSIEESLHTLKVNFIRCATCNPLTSSIVLIVILHDSTQVTVNLELSHEQFHSLRTFSEIDDPPAKPAGKNTLAYFALKVIVWLSGAALMWGVGRWSS